MSAVITVAVDLLREAANRRWFLALGVAIGLGLALVAFGLRLEVVDGALAASKLFGWVLDTDIRSVDVALRPVFGVASFLVSYFGTAFLILACADFAPSLLAPGRIEHLLSLPVRRWELLAGTFLGVWVIALIASVSGAGGLALILGLKTGAWSAGPVVAALLASASFATIYAAMLATSVFLRSAALSAAAGGLLFVAGIVASWRDAVGELFGDGLARTLFDVFASVCPRIGSVATAAQELAMGQPVDGAGLARLLVGMVVFSTSMLALGLWWFDERDF